MATKNESGDKPKTPPSGKPAPEKPKDGQPASDDRKPRGGGGHTDTSDKPDGVR